MHMYEIKKIVLINLLSGKKWRCRRKEETYGGGGERKAWKELIGSIDIYTPSCVK